MSEGKAGGVSTMRLHSDPGKAIWHLPALSIPSPTEELSEKQ